MKHCCKFTRAFGKAGELWHERESFNCARRHYESQTEAETDPMAGRRADRDHTLRGFRDLAGRSRRAEYPATGKSAELP